MFRSRPRFRRFLVPALLLCAARPAAPQGLPGLLIGDVVGRESGFPLGHAMVTVLGAERQTFTSDAGVFAFRGLEPGRYRLRVTRIGYVPADVDAEVPANGAPPRLRVALARLTVQLAMVKVLAKPVCTAPGRPDPTLNPDFAAVIIQLRLNAEHYKLLADSFPFAYAVERSERAMKGDSSRGTPRIDTLEFRTDHRGWEYKMGDMVERSPTGTYVMHLPDLRDFASYEFLNNHCFRYAGLDTTRQGVLLRIDFQADVQIRTPDVNGSILLDAQTYEIRRAELELSKIPPEVKEVTAFHVTTIFSEISPSIDVIHDVNGISSRRHSRLPWSTIATTEDQRMLRFQWLREDPAHPRTQP